MIKELHLTDESNNEYCLNCYANCGMLSMNLNHTNHGEIKMGQSEMVDKFDTTEKMKTSGKEQIVRYIEVVNDLVAKYWTDMKLTYKPCPQAEVKKMGSKYAKVVCDGSVHTFIDLRNGDILKAGSYAAPAKNGVRGNIFADDCGRSVITNHGAKYLK